MRGQGGERSLLLDVAAKLTRTGRSGISNLCRGELKPNQTQKGGKKTWPRDGNLAQLPPGTSRTDNKLGWEIFERKKSQSNTG